MPFVYCLAEKESSGAVGSLPTIKVSGSTLESGISRHVVCQVETGNVLNIDDVPDQTKTVYCFLPQ